MLERAVLVILVALAGCAAPRPSVLSGPDPADPASPSGPPTPRSVTTGIGVPLPAAAGDWTELNRRVSPGVGRAP